MRLENKLNFYWAFVRDPVAGEQGEQTEYYIIK